MTLVAKKLNQWKKEAMIFCAMHGKNGGQFAFLKWANGETMATPIVDGSQALPNMCIPLKTFLRLANNNWKFVA
jgi:hypothetical protein